MFKSIIEYKKKLKILINIFKVYHPLIKIMSSELINNISEFDYTRIHIESLNEKIKLFDSDEERKLCIYNYNNCNNNRDILYL